MKKVCIFVDGENLRFAIIDLFGGLFRPDDYLPKAKWGEFYNWLAQEVSPSSERVRTYWYVIQYIDFFPYEIPSLVKAPGDLKELLLTNPPYKRRLDEATDDVVLRAEIVKMANELNQRRKIMNSRLWGWTAIQNTIAYKHDCIEFRRAGAIYYNLFKESFGTEKAVDVNLATDMITLQNIYDIAIIVSGDQDYVPAVQKVKDFGKQVVNVVFKKQDGTLLPSGSRRLNQQTDRVWKVEYDKFKNFLNL